MVVPPNPLLRNPMTAALTDRKESMLFENTADIPSPRELESTQPEPHHLRDGKFRRGIAGRPPTGPPFRRKG